MKKQILAAAVAASISAVAMADISITGDAKYEYDLTDTNGVKKSTANTEAHINFTGKSGDTTFVAKFQLVERGTDGAVAEGGSATVAATSVDGDFDMEDTYITTTIAGVGVKAGNYASSNAALAGEIEDGGRSHGKVMLSYNLGDVSLYAGNAGKGTDGADQGTDSNMFAGASTTVAGQTIQIKKNSETLDSFGIKGSAGGVNYRYETQDSDTNGDATYTELSSTVSGLTVQWAQLKADKAAGLTEKDSAVFALEAATYGAKEQSQVAVSTTVDGNKVTVKSGTVDKGLSNNTKDLDYTQLSVSRALSSGATAVITYTNSDEATGDKTNLEMELNVKF
jgi:hypothetical protein